VNRYLTGLNLVLFRGFETFSFDGFKPITIVGGRNNCGKSSLLEAICFLANRSSGLIPGRLTWNRGEKMKSKTFSSLFYGGTNGGEIIIHGTFSDASTRGVDLECTQRSAVDFGLEEPPEGVTNVNGELPPAYVQQFYTSFDGGQTKRGAMLIAFTKNEYRCYPLNPKEEKSEFKKSGDGSVDGDWRCVFYESQRRQDVSKVYSELFGKGREDVLLAALQAMDRRITTIAYDGERLLVQLRKNALRLPLGVMGDGMVKAAEILSMLAMSPAGSVACLDEIENGLHYTVMQGFWSSIVQLARKREIQIVATTHNLEMMQALARDVLGKTDDFAFVNLTRSASDEVSATAFTYDEFVAHLESGVEMR